MSFQVFLRAERDLQEGSIEKRTQRVIRIFWYLNLVQAQPNLHNHQLWEDPGGSAHLSQALLCEIQFCWCLKCVLNSRNWRSKTASHAWLSDTTWKLMCLLACCKSFHCPFCIFHHHWPPRPPPSCPSFLLNQRDFRNELWSCRFEIWGNPFGRVKNVINLTFSTRKKFVPKSLYYIQVTSALLLFKYTSVYVCICVYTYVYIHIYIYIYIYMHTHICLGAAWQCDWTEWEE